MCSFEATIEKVDRVERDDVSIYVPSNALNPLDVELLNWVATWKEGVDDTSPNVRRRIAGRGEQRASLNTLKRFKQPALIEASCFSQQSLSS